MTTSFPEPKRWQEIATIWKDNRWLYLVAGLLLGLLITPALEQITGDLNVLIGNLVPEAVGIIFTVLILERLAENRQRENYKQDLIRRAGSVANSVAIDAIEQLRKEGWLKGNNGVLKASNLHQSNLKQARLEFANLQQVNLEQANMQQANLEGVKLQNANLELANLQDAILTYANLESANLYSANLQAAELIQGNLQRANLIKANLRDAHLMDTKLQAAYLQDTNLQSAILWRANLQAANLSSANLCDTQLYAAKFNEQTVLPDAILISDPASTIIIYDKYWTPETDMTRYTNPEHPNFWEPDWVKEQRKEGSGE